MAPSSPSNSSNSSEASSPNVNEASSSLFLSLNAKSEPNSPESDSSPIETSIITQSTTTTTLENNNINTLSSVANNSATTNATHSSSNKSSPSSHDDEKSASSQAITKPGNSSTVKKAVGTTNGVNSASDSSSSTVIPQQYHQSTIPTATTSATPNTTNTSTTTTSSPSSGVQPSTPNKPVLVQSKKAIHPHQPMNAYLPPQLIHHPPQLYDPNMPYQQPPVRVANANGKQTVAYGAPPAVHGHLHYAYAFPPGAHPSLVQSQPPTAFYPPPPQPQHGSTVGVVHDANSLYMPVMPHPTLPNSEAESSDDESGGEYSESDEEEGYTIVTMQKPSPYTEIKKKYEDLMKLYTKACKELTAAQAEISELKRKREATGSRGGFPQPSSSNSTLSPAVKKKKTESPISEPIRRTDLIPLGVDRNGNQRSAFQQLETSITSLPPPSTSVVPTSPSSDTSSSVSLNTLVYIYYYDGGCDGHGSRQLKANGKRIFIDINWDEIFKFRQDDCLHMCIFVNTSTVDKVKDSDLIATFKILRSDGDKVKISKIRENLRRLNLQNQFSHIGHIKFFIQIRGNDQLFDYTDKILLYSKTQHNIANFEPSNQKEYNELSKLFYQPERFTVFKKV